MKNATPKNREPSTFCKADLEVHLSGRTSERQGAVGQTKECAEIIIFPFFKKRQRKGGDGKERNNKKGKGEKKRWPGETGQQMSGPATHQAWHAV